jgi:hypothetical protein
MISGQLDAFCRLKQRNFLKMNFILKIHAAAVVLMTLFGLTIGYANTESNPNSLIIPDYFTSPIPAVSSWYDPMKRIGTQGPLKPDTTFVFSSKPGDTQLAFEIEKLTRRGPCFGTFRESERLYNGYVVHFKSDPARKKCENTVNHAFLIPTYWRPETEFLLRLYDGPVYKGELRVDLKKIGKKTIITVSEKEKLKQIYKKIEDEMTSLHRAKKMNDFMNHPDYEKAKPLYDTCMDYKMKAEGHRAFTKEGYCLCIAQKFAYGDQLSDEELDHYAQDFDALLRTKDEQSDMFYASAINNCKNCRYKTENRDLKGFCTGAGLEIGKYSNTPSSGKILTTEDNYTHLLDKLLSDDYKSVRKDLVFKNFFVDYLQTYSASCGKKHISNGVYRKTKHWTEDQNTGFKIGPEQVYELYVDNRYVSLFDRYSNEINQYYKAKFLSGNAMLNLMKTMEGIKKEVFSNLDARLVIRRHMGQGCTSEPVKKVYDRLLSLGEAKQFKKKKPVKKLRAIKQEDVTLPAKLENPDGLFRVTKEGVLECRVIKSEGDGTYRIHWNVVAHNRSGLATGQLAQGGIWYPDHQQFYIVPYLFFGEGHDCNGWKNDWAEWSSTITPEVFVTHEGNSFPGYNYTGKSPTERAHGTKSCLNARTDGSSCRVSCTRWEMNRRLPKKYLVWEKDQAIALFQYLNIGGAKVVTGSEAKAAEAEAKAEIEAAALKKAEEEKALDGLRLSLLQDKSPVQFPKNLVISAKIHDFLLARFYPDRLNADMLHAMMSSRWAYEKSVNNPLGGRFFKPDSRPPTYDELKRLTHYFKPWLMQRAEALPQILSLEATLDYGQMVMQIKNNCFQFLKHDGSSSGIDPNQVHQAEQKIKECEKQNKQTRAWLNHCQGLQDELKTAEAKLAHAQANDCKQVKTASKEGETKVKSCADMENLTLANLKAEMLSCISEKCGNPSTVSDAQSYSQCVQTVSEQFQRRLGQLLGRKSQPVQKQTSDQGINACERASTQIAQIKKNLKNSYCNTTQNIPEITDCKADNTLNIPDAMEIGRINLEPMLHCEKGASLFHHGYRESAEFLPKQKPFIKTQFFLMLHLDNLILPYDLPPEVSNNGSKVITARIKLEITGTDPRSFRRHQLGLKAKVNNIVYNQ